MKFPHEGMAGIGFSLITIKIYFEDDEKQMFLGTAKR
jgi:hypothetical protein